MWSLIKALLLRLAAARWIFKILSLGLLAPIAFLLKLVGLPVLMVLGVLALPLLMLLFVLGLPVFLVLLVGGGLLGVLFAMLSVGLVALKVFLLVVLPVMLVMKLVSWIGRRRHGPCCGRKTTGASDATDTPGATGPIPEGGSPL